MQSQRSDHPDNRPPTLLLPLLQHGKNKLPFAIALPKIQELYSRHKSDNTRFADLTTANASRRVEGWPRVSRRRGHF